MFEGRSRGGCGGGGGPGTGEFFVEVDSGGEAFPEGGVADDGHFLRMGVFGRCYRWREVWVEHI